ncbi:MAG: hypothetical protein FJ291_14300 [Planctomycetes bacterium]|nr:hypothetical protein [Planctomycetota bacterium]
MSVTELHAMAGMGVCAALTCLLAAAVSCAAAAERTAAGDASGGRRVPAIDAEAPAATQTATFATG